MYSKEDKPPKAIRVTNKFQTLSDNEDNMETLDLPNTNSQATTADTQEFKPKLPPILISWTANYSNIVKTMKATMVGTFKIFYLKDGLKIHTNTLEDFKALQTMLKKTGQEYHTYTLPRDKPLKVVIKDLPPNMLTEEIREELQLLGYSPTDVRKFTSNTQHENSPHDQATTVTTNTKSGHINFVAAYNPPSKRLLKQDLNNVTSAGNFFIGGDLNSKNTVWNSRMININRRILEEHSDEIDYNILAPDTPTYYPGDYLHIPDIIDIILTNLKITPDTITVLQELDSDHNPLLCEWEVNLEHKTNWRKPKISTTDWNKYKLDQQEALLRNIDIHTEQDIDAAIYLFTTTLQESYKLNTTTSQKQHEFKIDHPELRYLLALKREAPTNLLKTWTLTKVLKGISKRSNTPGIHGQLGMAYTSGDKAKAIALTLEDQLKPNPIQDENFNREVTRSVNNFIQRPMTETPAPVTKHELQATIKQLKQKKVTGLDGWCHKLCVAECCNGGISHVDGVLHRAFPVRVLVNGSVEDLRQMVRVSVTNVSSDYLVPPLTFETHLNVHGRESPQRFARHYPEQKVITVPTGTVRHRRQRCITTSLHVTIPVARGRRETLDVRVEVCEQFLLKVLLDDDSIYAGSEGAEVGGCGDIRLEEVIQWDIPETVDNILVVTVEVLRYGTVDLTGKTYCVADWILDECPTAQGGS
uniref:Endonuclease/exonuclease/phosphatase domain-containing protein n=1 Tax=Timema shepardi TaxID=629360 RepID=A0A7R9ARK4_TIMSH|nr:unnamed protein product [Timema shepardi]